MVVERPKQFKLLRPILYVGVFFVIGFIVYFGPVVFQSSNKAIALLPKIESAQAATACSIVTWTNPTTTTAGRTIPTTKLYLGAAFLGTCNGSGASTSATVTSISPTLTNSVGVTGFSNMRIYTDTVASCTTPDPVATATPIGSNAAVTAKTAVGISGTNTIGPGLTRCFYVVVDVGPTASAQTVKVSIAAAGDIVETGFTTAGTFPLPTTPGTITLSRVCTSNQGTFNWSSASAWSNCSASTPASGDNVFIQDGSIITEDTGNPTVASITLMIPTDHSSPSDGANTLKIADGQTLTVTGALAFAANSRANAQTVTLGTVGGAGNLTVGSISIPAATSTGISKINCFANASQSGLLLVTGAGTISITGSSTASGGASSIDMSPGACRVTTGTVAGTVVTLTAGTVSAALLKMGTGTLTMNGNLVFAGATANLAQLNMSANTGTLALNGATMPIVGSSGQYTITASTNLNSSGSSNWNYATSVSTWGLIHVTGGTLNFTTTQQATGISVDAGATMTTGGANSLITTSTLTVNGTISGASGIVSCRGCTIDGSTGNGGAASVATTGVNDITAANGTVAASANLTYANLTIAAHYALTITAGGILNISGILTMAVGDNTGLPEFITLGTNSQLNVTGATNFNQPNVAVTTSINVNDGIATFGGLFNWLGNSSTTSINKVVVTTGTVNFNGGIAFTAGGNANHVLDMSAGAGILNLKGAISASPTVTFTMGTTSTFVYNDTAAQTILMPPAGAYANLKIMNTPGGATLGNNITTALVTQAITVGNGTVAAILKNGGFAIAMNNAKAFTVNDNADFQMTGTSNLPTWADATKPTFTSNSTVEYNQSTAPTMTTAITYGNLAFKTATNTLTFVLPAAITIGGSLTIGAGVATGLVVTAATGNPTLSVASLSIANNSSFIQGSNSLTVLGAMSVGNGTLGAFTGSAAALNIVGNLTLAVGSTWTKGAGTVTFKSGTGSQTLTDSTASKQDLGTVQISANTTNTTLSLGSNVKFTNVTIDANQILDVTAAPFNITLNGNWTNNGGTAGFNARSGTVALATATAATFTGTTTFSTFTATAIGFAKTVNFQNGVIFTFNNATLNGASGQVLTINSTSSGSQWLMHLNNATTSTFIAVKDGGCHTGTSADTMDINSTWVSNNGVCWPVPPNNCTSFATGNWSAPGSWTSCGGGIPGTLDQVTIASGHTITVNTGNPTVVSIALNLGAGGISISTGQTLTVSGAITFLTGGSTPTITLNGTGNLNAGSLTMTAPSFVTCASGASGTLNISGALNLDNSNDATTTMSMLTCTLTVGGLTTFTSGGVSQVTLQSSTGTLNFNGGITFGGSGPSRDNLTTTGAATINLTGNMAGLGTLSLFAGTVLKTHGASAINAAYTTLKDLEVVDGTTTLGASITVTNVTIDNGAILDHSTRVITDTGNYTNNGTHNGNSGGNGITISGASSVVDGIGTYSSADSFVFSGATPSFAATANITIAGLIGINAGVTVTNNGTVTTTTTLGIVGSNATTSIWTQGNNSTLNFGGSTTSLLLTGILNANATGNTVNYNLNGAQTCKVVTYFNLTLSGGGAKTCLVTTVNANLVVNNGAGSTTWSLGSNVATNVTTAGTSSIGAGATVTATSTFTLDVGTQTIVGNFQVDGTYNGAGTGGTTVNGDITGTGTITRNGGANTFEQQLHSNANFGTTTGSNNWAFSTLTFSNSATDTALTSTASSGGTGTISAVSVLVGQSGDDATGPGSPTTLDAANRIWNISANNGNLVILSSPQGVFLTNASTVNYTSQAGGTVLIVPLTYYNLGVGILAGASSGCTFTLNGNTVVTSTFTVNSETTTVGDVFSTSGTNYSLSAGQIVVATHGTFQAQNSLITITGTGTPFTKNGIFTPGGSTVQYTNATANVTATTYNNLTLGGSGTYTMPAGTVTINGNFTNNGTFDANGGTVALATSATATISSSSAISFNNFSATAIGAAKTIKFNSTSPIYTFTGTVTLNGASGQVLSIQSTTPGSQWIMHLNSGTSPTWVAVTDGGCDPGGTSNATADTNSTLSNVGTCWPAPARTCLSVAGAVIWAANASWTNCNSTTPQIIDSVTIISGSTVTLNSTVIGGNSNTGTNVSVVAITIANPTVANGLTVSTGITLNVTNAITNNTNTSAVTQTITVSGTGAVNAGSLTLTGNSTSTGTTTFALGTGALTTTGAITINGGSNATGLAKLTASTGTISAAGITLSGGAAAVSAEINLTGAGTLTTTNGLTFSGTVADTKLTTGGAATINLTGTMSGLGVLSLLAGTNLKTHGISAINSAYTTLKNLWVADGTTTLGAAINAVTSVQIDALAALNVSTFLLTNTGNYTNNGTQSGSGGMTLSGATAVVDGQGIMTGTVTFSGATPSFASTANISLGKIAISGAIIVTNNGIVTTTDAAGITGTASGSTWTQAANSTLNFGGDTTSLLSTGTLNATNTGNTVVYNEVGTGSQTCKLTSYYNLALSGTGTKTCNLVSGTHTLGGNFIVGPYNAFSNPNGLTIDSANNKIYMSDSGNNRVVRFDSGGGATTYGANWQSFGLTGSSTGQLQNPRGVAIDTVNNKLLITDTDNSRIVRIDSGGGGTTFGANWEDTNLASFVQPVGIDVDPTNNRAYISNTVNNRVVAIDSGGGGTTFGSNYDIFGSIGSGINQFISPKGIAVDSGINKLIINDGNGRIVRIDSGTGGTTLGQNWQTFGSSGSGTNQFSNPTLLALDVATNKIYVTDTSNNRVVKMDSGGGGTTLGQNWTSFGVVGSSVNQLQAPSGVGVDTTNNRIYISDQSNFRTVRVDSGSGATTLGQNWKSFGIGVNGGAPTWTSASTFPTITGNLISDAGGTLSPAGFALTVTGTTYVNGIMSIQSATGTKAFNGDVIITGDVETTGVIPLTYPGNFHNSGIFTPGTGIQTFSGVNKTISGSRATTIPNATINGTITNNTTLTVSTALAGTGTLTNGATGTLSIGQATAPFASGTLVANVSGNTVKYTAAAPNCYVTVYHHLTFSGGAGAITCATLATVNGNLTFSPSGAKTYTIPAAGLTIGGNLVIGANMTLTSSTGTVSLGGNFDNSGAFTNNAGTIAFTGAVIHDIKGSSSTIFHNMSDTVDASTLRFKNDAGGVTPLYTFDTNGILTVTGGASKITITSDTGSPNKWLVHFNTAQSSVTNAIVSWSDCDGTSQTVSLDGNDSTNGGNNGSCWTFTAAGIAITGTVYTDEATTALTGVTPNIRVARNGALSQFVALNSGNGTFTLPNVTGAAIGDILTVFVDTGTAANQAALVTKIASTSAALTLNLRTGRVILRYETGSSITNGVNDLQKTCDSGDAGCGNVPFAISGTALTVAANNKLLIPATYTYAPGGDVTTPAMEVAGTYTGASETLVLNGAGSNATCTTAAGTMTPLCISGTFTAPTTTQYTAATATVAGTTFTNLTLGGNGTYTLPASDVTLRGDLTVSGTSAVTKSASNKLIFAKGGGGTQILTSNGTNSDLGIVKISANGGDTTLSSASSFTVTTLTADSFQNLNIDSDTITITGDGGAGGGGPTVAFAIGGSNTFTITGSTVVYTGTTVTVTGNITYNNLSVIPASAGAIGWQSFTTITLRGNLIIGSNATVTKGTSTTTTFARTSTGTSTWTDNHSAGSEQDIGVVQVSNGGGVTTLSTSTNVKATKITVDASQILDITSQTLTLTGSTTPLTATSGNSSFTSTGSTVVYAGTGATNIAGLTYNNLSFTPASGTPTYTLLAADITLRGNLLISTGTAVTKSAANKIIFAAGGAQTVIGNGTNSDLGILQVSANSTPTTLSLGSSIKATSITVDNSQNLTLGANIFELTGTGTPLTLGNGTFTVTGSTFKYTGNGATTTAATYNNLSLLPGGATDQTIGAGSYTVGGNLLVGNSTNAGATGAATNPTISVTGTTTIADGATLTQGTGSFTLGTLTIGGGTSGVLTSGGAVNVTAVTISAGGTLTANSSNITIGGNFTNNGTFTACTCTVVFNGSGTSTLSGATTFNNFTAATPGQTIKFTSGQTFRIDGLLTLTGTGSASNQQIHIDSSNSSTKWFMNHQGTESIAYVELSNSGCDGTSTQITMDANSVNTINNDTTCWVFPAVGIVITGTVYTDEASTALTGVSPNIRVARNGVLSQFAALNSGNGTFTLPALAGAAIGDIFTVFVDTSTAANQGVLVTRIASTNAPLTLNLRTGRVILRYETGSSITNGVNDLQKACDSGASGCGNVPFAISGTALAVAANNKLLIPATYTYAPGGDVTAPAMEVAGTYTGNTETLILNGAGSNATCTTAAGTMTPLCISGTFTAPTTTQYTAATATVAGTTFTNLTLGGNGTYTLPASDVTLRGDLTVNGTSGVTKSASNKLIFAKGGGGTQILTSNSTNSDLGIVQVSANTGNTTLSIGSNVKLTTMTTDASQNLTLGANIFELTGTGTPLTLGNGTFTVTGSTFKYTGNGATTTAATYNNLSLLPGGATDQTIGAGSYTVGGNLLVGNSTNAGATGAATNPTISVTGTTTIADGATLTQGTNPFTFTGAVTVGGGTSGTFVGANGTINLIDNLTITPNATWTKGAGVLVFKKGSTGQTVTDSFATKQDLGAIQVSTNSGATTLNLGSSIKVTTVTTDASQNLTLGANTLEITGNNTPLTLGNGTFTVTGSTVLYSNAVAATITATTFNNLTLGGAGNYTFPAATLNIGGNLLVNSSAVASPGAGGTVNVTGNFTVDGILSGPGADTITVNGNIDGSGTISLTGNTIEQRVSAAKNFGATSGAVGWSFNNLTFSNGHGSSPFTISTQTGGTGTITVNGVLTLGKGTDAAGATTTLDAGNRTWLLSNTDSAAPLVITTTPQAVLTASTSDFQFTGNKSAGDVTVPAATYNKLTLGGGSAENYSIGSSTVVANNNLTVNANGTLIGSGTLTVKKDVTGAGTITMSGGTFEQQVGAAQNFGTTSGTTNWAFNNLTFSNSSASTGFTVTADGHASPGTITVNGVLTIGKGTDTAVTTLAAANRTWILAGTTGTPMVITSSPQAVLTANTSDFQFTGNNAGGNTTIPAATFNKLTLNNGSESFDIGSASVTANDNLTITAGTLIGSGTMTAKKDVTGAGTITMSGGTFEQKVAAAQNFGTTSGSTVWTFNNLTFSNSTGVSATITTDGHATPGGISVNGTLTIGGASDSANTTLTGGNRTWTLLGNLLNRSTGRFTKATSSIVFGGGVVQTITDSAGTKQDLGAVSVAINGTNTTLNLATNSTMTSLNINASQTFSANGGNTLVLSGGSTPLTIGASATFDASTGTVQYTGTNPTVTATTFNHLILGGSSAYTLPASNWTIKGNLTVTSPATVTKGNGTIIIGGGTTQTVTDNTAGNDFGKFQISANGGSNSSLRVAASTTLQATTLLVDSLQTFDLTQSNAFFRILGSGTGSSRPFINNGTFSSGATNTFTYQSTSATEIESAGTYGSLIIGAVPNNGASVTYTLNGNLALSSTGILTLGRQGMGAANNDTLDATVANYNISAGSVVVTALGILNVRDGTLTLLDSGTPITNSGTLTLGNNSTVAYTSTGSTNIVPLNYKNLSLLPAGTVTYTFGSGTTAVANNFLIGNGSNALTASTTTNSPTINVSGNLTVASGSSLSGSGTGIITVNGNVDGAGTINLSGGSFVQNVASSKNFGTTSGSADWSFKILTFSASAGTPTITTQAGTGGITMANSVTSVLTVGANVTLNAGNRTWTFQRGGGAPLVLTGTLVPATSTFVYSPSSGSDNVAAATYFNLTLGTGAGGGTALPNSNITLRGNLLANGTVTKGTGTLIFASGTANQTLTGSGDIGAIQVSANTTNTTLKLLNDVTVTSVVVDNSQTLDVNGNHNLTLTGNGTVLTLGTGPSFIPSTGTVSFVSAGTSGTNVPAIGYNNLLVAKTGNIFTVGTGTLNINGNLDVNAGTLNLNASDPSTVVGGVTTVNDILQTSDTNPLTIKGNWNYNNSPFVANGPMAIDMTGFTSYNNAPIIIGGTASAQTFKNLSVMGKGNLQFKSHTVGSPQFNFTGVFNVQGTPSFPIYWTSTTPGTQWLANITSTGSSNVDFAFIKDGGCVNGTKSFVVTSTVNGGSNLGTCWPLISQGFTPGDVSGGTSSTNIGMAQSRVQQITTGTTDAMTFTAANAAGDTIIVYAVWGNAGTVAINDSRGNTYNAVASATTWNSSWKSQLFYAKGITNGINTVTATFGTTISNFATVYAFEYKGLDFSNPFDQTVSATGSSTSLNSGNVSTTSNQELIFGAGSSASGGLAVGSGFIPRLNTFNSIIEDKVVTTSGSYSASATAANAPWVMNVASFRTGVQGGGGQGFTGGSSGSTSNPSFKQNIDTNAGTGVSSASVTFGAVSTSGDLIVVAVKWGSPSVTVSTITDSQGNSYLPAVGPISYSTDTKAAEIFYAKNISGGTAPTQITVTMSGSVNSNLIVAADEYQGFDSVDQIKFAAGSTTNENTSPIATNVAFELIYGAAFNDTAVTAAGPGFNSRSTISSNMIEDKLVQTLGNYNVAFTGSAAPWVNLEVAFRVSGAEESSGGGNPAGTIHVDSTSPDRFAGTPADNVDITSASFTPPASSLLLMLVNADTSTGTSITVAPSDSRGLTWTKITQSDFASSGVAGHASAWYALQPTSQAMTVSVKRTTSGGGTNEISALVYVITGYNTTTPIGSSGNGSSSTNSISPTVYTSSIDNSVGFGTATDKAHLGLPTSTDTYDAASYSNAISVLSALKAAPTSTSGTAVTLNFDAFGSNSASWNWVGFEVKPFVASQGGGGGGGGSEP